MPHIILPLSGSAVAASVFTLPAQADAHYLLIDSDTGQSPARLEQQRVGNDLHLSIPGSEESLILQDYYGQGEPLLLGSDAGAYQAYQSDADGLYHLAQAAPAPQSEVLLAQTLEGGSAPPIRPLAALLGTMTAIALLGKRSGGDDKHADPQPHHDHNPIQVQPSPLPSPDSISPSPSNQAGTVSISGTPQVNGILTAHVADADGMDAGSLRYQWFADNAPIAGAQGASYRLTAQEQGKRIHVLVRYTDQAAHQEHISSDYLPAVAGELQQRPWTVDPALPRLSLIGDAVVKEGGSAAYKVVLSEPAATDISVDIRLIDESTQGAQDAAIRWNSQRVVIPAGETEAKFSVDIQADGLAEGRETYRIELGAALAGQLYADAPAAPAQPVEQQSVIIPAYRYPDADGYQDYWQPIQAAGGGKIPFVVINPASGAGDAVNRDYTQLLQDNADAGIDNIAYIKTLYAERPVEEVKAEVHAYIDRYGGNIHGFFFDEVGTLSNHQTLYLAEIYNYVKALSADLLVVANPGAYISDSIAPYADIFATSEVSADTYLNHYKTPRSAFENDSANAAHIYHIIHSADPAQYQQILELSRERNAGWIYITSDSEYPDNNPYNELPADFSRLIDAANSGTPHLTPGQVQAMPSAVALDNQALQTVIIDADSAFDPHQGGKQLPQAQPMQARPGIIIGELNSTDADQQAAPADESAVGLSQDSVNPLHLIQAPEADWHNLLSAHRLNMNGILDAGAVAAGGDELIAKAAADENNHAAMSPASARLMPDLSDHLYAIEMPKDTIL